MTALQIRNRIRFAQAQQNWDDMSPQDYDDGIEDRLMGIEEARRCLDAAAKHIERGELAQADQEMANAVGYLVP